MKGKVILTVCALAALSLSTMVSAGTSRSMGRNVAHHAGNRTSSTPFSVGFSGTRSNEHGTVSHTGSTSSLEPSSFFHEGTTSITTSKGSKTHDGSSSKSTSMTQHVGTTTIEKNGNVLIDHHGYSSKLTNSDGTISRSHSGYTHSLRP